MGIVFGDPRSFKLLLHILLDLRQFLRGVGKNKVKSTSLCWHFVQILVGIDKRMAGLLAELSFLELGQNSHQLMHSTQGDREVELVSV